LSGRPVAAEGLASGGRFAGNVSSGAGALAGGTSPANRAVGTTHLRYAIDAELGLSIDRLNQSIRRKTPDPEIRQANGPFEEVVPFDGRIERPTLTMHGTGDLVPIHLADPTARSPPQPANLLVQRIYRTGPLRVHREEQSRPSTIRGGAMAPTGWTTLGDPRTPARRSRSPGARGIPAP
jgi:hypothetical protein